MLDIYESPSIIKYIEPIIGDLFTIRFAYYHFHKSIFPTLGGESEQLVKKNDWNYCIYFI